MTLTQLGDYYLEKRIGEGGMGEVYRARQLSLDRTVAVKLLPRSLAAQPNFIERFQREAKAAANLIHPNVIQIYSIGVEQGIPYFAMEYVEGEDLQQRMRRVGRLSFEASVDIVHGVASALACAYEKGIVHRDIKPSNIMLDRNDVVKVMDFGLAKATREVGASLTAAGLIMGTPNYISPEQARGEDSIDSRSDIYSLGIVFYELATGVLPFRADTPAALIYKHAFEEPEPPTTIAGDVPPFIEEIVLRMIAKESHDRYPNPKALLADLNEFQRSSTYYLQGGARKAPAVMESGSRPERTTRDVQSGSADSTLQVSTGGFRRAQTMPDDRTDPTLVQPPLPRRRSGAWVLLVVLLILVGGAVVYLGPLGGAKQLGLTGNPRSGGGGEGRRFTDGGRSGSDGAARGETVAGGRGIFPGGALRRHIPESVKAFIVKDLRPYPLTYTDQLIQPGPLTLRFEKRGYREVLLSVEVTAGSNGSAIVTKVKEALAQGFVLTDGVTLQLRQAKDALRDKDFDTAIRVLVGVLQLAPDLADARELLSDAKRDQRELRLVFDRGQALHARRRWQPAIDQLRKVPETSPDYGSAQGLISSAEANLGRLDGIRSSFANHLATGQFGGADADIREVERLVQAASEEPKQLAEKVKRARDLLTRAKEEFRAGAYQAAIDKLEALGELSPKHEALLSDGFLGRARKQLKAEMLEARTVTGGLHAARAHIEAGRFAEAVTAAQRVLDAKPGSKPALEVLAQAEAGVARHDIQKALEGLDLAFKARRPVEILARVDVGPAREALAQQLRRFFAAPIAIVEAKHTDLHTVVHPSTIDDPAKAEVECWWNVTLAFPTLKAAVPPVKTTQSIQIRQRVKLRKAETWMFQSFEQIEAGADR